MHSIRNILISSLLLWSLQGCEEFVAIDLPNTMLTTRAVYQSDATATAAALSMYESMQRIPSFSSSGSSSSIATVAGLCSDEFDNYLTQNEVFVENSVEASNNAVFQIWSSAYYTIFTANSVIEGISQGSVSTDLGNQLTGEALFVRAFTLFYLTNLFGSVPLVTSTDYRNNAGIPRSSQEKIYEQIIDDLVHARQLLPEEYVSAERTRPNVWSATALLSRVFLYTQRWADAEAMASILIDQHGTFDLELPADAFLKGSKEAIWQLSTPYADEYNTTEGSYFILDEVPSIVAIRQDAIESFEDSDQRFSNWIGSYTTDGSTYYFVNKYKEKGGTDPLFEHSILLRLSELYLIRAEARVQQGKTTGTDSAEDDINVIRTRAGLSNTSAVTDAGLLQVIEKERRVELIGEWGHRWFDLKRTGRADAVLSLIKPSWSSSATLLPVPESEILSNSNLLPQNPGY